MDRERMRATYLIETAGDPKEAAALMAGEQSSGTFVAVPGETEALKARHAAQVESVEEVERVAEPSLPGARPPPPGADRRPYRRARAVLSFPRENIGDSLPNLLVQVAGNLAELKPLSGIRLLDVEVGEAFARAQPGSAFGVAGTRRLAGVEGRPIIGTIVKPSVGLTPEETAELVGELIDAGLDFFKDDELIANPPYSPVAERARAVMGVVEERAQKTGRKAMYAFNITDEIEAMKRHHDVVRDAGGTCVMASLIPLGLAGLLALRRHSELPIHAHRNGWGFFSRHPMIGFDYRAFQKLFRLAGADHMHVNGLRNKFCESDESVLASARACLEPLPGHGPCLPVFSSGQWAGQIFDTYAGLGSADLMYLCGGGILAHPDGPAAGVRSVRQAWEAACAGEALVDAARAHPELAAAVAHFGSSA